MGENLLFPNEYFEDQVRDGFYVPGEVKRAWGAELEVLSEVDKICRKHGITYFADWGTLLATVRHEGYIPWDDDLDIVMKREDYERFMEIANQELPEGFQAYNYKNHEDFWLFLARVVGKPRICFEPDHLERFHQFPYIAGVDIFVLDYVSRDPEEEKERDRLAMYVLAVADGIAEGSVKIQAAKDALKKIEQETGIPIPMELSGDDLRRFLYGVVEQLFSKFREDQADQVTQLFPFGMKDANFRFPKKYYEKAIRLPYENTTMPLPIGYVQALRRRYGNFMHLIRNAGGHDYPFYEEQHRKLIEVLDFTLPVYTYDPKDLRKKEASPTAPWKQLAESYCQNISEEIEKKNYPEAQQLSMDLGNFIENLRGEGRRTVGLLEELCELLYQADLEPDNEALERTVRETGKELLGTFREEMGQDQEVVFQITKAASLPYLLPFIKRELEKEQVILRICPITYYYKNYDGSLHDPFYQGDQVRESLEKTDLLSKEDKERLSIVDEKTYDYSLFHPDRIYIDNPFDQWNPITQVAPEHFAKNLQQCCGKLIYVQSFEVVDFTPDAYREFRNMKEYVLRPGVVCADQVFTNSEQMRRNYIEKLTKWAGEDTREIWEAKICWIPSDKSQEKKAIVEEKKKRIAMFLQPGSFAVEPEKVLQKIQRSLRLFEEQKERLDLVWIYDSKELEELEACAPVEGKKYKELLREQVTGHRGLCLDRQQKTLGEILESCQAYYGEESSMGLEFALAGKPAMIMDMDV